MRRVGALLALVLAVWVGIGASGVAEAAPRAATPARRVLIFSIPFVSWDQIQSRADELPNLRRLLATSGVAALTTRASDQETTLGDGYMTLGAGTRAVGFLANDGDGVGVDERFGADTGSQVFEQRTGRKVRRGIVNLGLPRIVEANDELLYNAEVGALGRSLAAAGFARAVIANGDGQQPDTPSNPSPSDPDPSNPQPTSTLRRQAALGLMGTTGVVPAGRVDDGLLEADPSAPYGLRLNRDAAVAAFDGAWTDRAAVLVEASDLVRADAYRQWSSPAQRGIALTRALRRSDELLGRVLERVDLHRDAVVVVGPAHSSRVATLTVLGVHTPSGEAGLLRSATTRRAGFVQLIDVAPTILDAVGVDRPASMEGRPAEVRSTGSSMADRVSLFTREDAAAQFRDNGLVGQVQVAFVALSAIVAIGVVLSIRSRRPRSATLVGRLALILLALLPATFLARLVPFQDVGLVAYWAFLIAVAGALGAGYAWLGRRRPTDALLDAFGVIIGLLVVDVVLGGWLEFNSALGYSPIAARRFVGFSNPTYAAVGAAAVLGAPLLATRIGGRRGQWCAVALLAVVMVVDGAPFWGSDVGGILSMVPAYGVSAVLILGWRVRRRTVAWCALALVVAVVGFTALDLTRPVDERTHLGRLVERIQDGGFGDFVVVLQRKLDENVASLRGSVWGLVVLIALGLGWWLVRRAPERVAAVRRAVPESHIALVGFTILAVLGYALNDSGIAIPGVMLVVLLGASGWLLCRIGVGGEGGADGEREARPVPIGAGAAPPS